MLHSRVHSCSTSCIRSAVLEGTSPYLWYLFWFSQTAAEPIPNKEERMASRGKWGGKGGPRWLRQVSLRSPPSRQRERTDAGALSRVQYGSTRPQGTRGTDDPTLPTVKVNPPTGVPVEASHSRKAQGDHGQAGRPAAAGAWFSGSWVRDAGGGVCGSGSREWA